MTKRWATAVGIAVLVVFAIWIPGTRMSTTRQRLEPLPEVTRHMPEVLGALRTAGVALDIPKVKRGDAWREPSCGGMAVFLRTDTDAFWGWVGPDTKRLSEYLRASDVLNTIQKQLDVETNGLTWDFDQDGPGGRPRYVVGATKSGSYQISMRLQTEACGIRQAELQISKSDGDPQIQSISFQPNVEPRYSSQRDSVPLVSRTKWDTAGAFEAAGTLNGMTTNYVGDAWVESACSAVIVYQEAGGRAVWTLVDKRTHQVRESVRELQVRAALQAALGDAFVAFPNPWIFEQDAPGARPRYRVGYMKNSQNNTWIHPNSQSCTLQTMQVQLAPSADSMGKFTTLSIPPKPE